MRDGKKGVVIAVHYENRLSGERSRKEIRGGYEKYWGEKH